MNKRINGSLVLLALCMQQGSGIVVAEVDNFRGQNSQVNKSDLSRRLLRLEDQLKAIPDVELKKVNSFVHEIIEVYDEADKRFFEKTNSTSEQRNYLKNKFQELAQRFRSTQFSKHDVDEVARYIDKIEKLGSSKK